MNNKLIWVIPAAVVLYLVFNSKRIDKVSFDTKTPLGKIDVSLVTFGKNDTVLPSDGVSSYVSKQFGFRLSWPNNGKWTAYNNFGAPGDLWPAPIILPSRDTNTVIPIYLSRSYPFELNRPESLPVSMYVAVQVLENQESIAEYMQASFSALKQLGWVVVDSSINESTQSGAATFIDEKSMPTPIYRFARFAVKAKRAYVQESHFFSHDILSREWKQEVVQIFNSFQVEE